MGEEEGEGVITIMRERLLSYRINACFLIEVFIYPAAEPVLVELGADSAQLALLIRSVSLSLLFS